MEIVKKKIDFPTFDVISDGAISMAEVGEGRMIPSIIIDIENYVEISDLIKLHRGNLPGDIQPFWMLQKTFFKQKWVILNLNFIKPLKISIGIKFTLAKDLGVIEGIIRARSVYLQAGKIGDKVSDLKNESILIEVPFLEFDSKWDNIIIDILKKRFKDKGYSKKDSLLLANEQLKETRKLWNLRRSIE